jgi:cysteine desulfurase
MKSIYLDHAATTPIDLKVQKKMIATMKHVYGNPSSLHIKGIEARQTIEDARIMMAQTIHANPSEIYFCSGGTEATNWAIKGYARLHPEKKEIITTPIEHHATLHTLDDLEKQGYQISDVPVDDMGFIDLIALEKMISTNTLMVSVIWANNEIGTIQDIQKIARICNQKGVICHVDGVQAFGQVKIDLRKQKIDLLTLSAHKFYGPKGIGMLYIREGILLDHLIAGGRQEFGLRAGTENVLGIVGMSYAAYLANRNLKSYVRQLTDLSVDLYESIREIAPDVILNGPEIGIQRLSSNLNLSFTDVKSNDLIFQLSERGLYLSAGSACTSTSIEPSHVLQAIGTPDSHIHGTIRISFGKDQTLEDNKLIILHLKDALDTLRTDLF